MYTMHLVKEYPLKIQVTCQKCSDLGYINKTCSACNGKGVHNKTLIIYKVDRKPWEIIKIDRDSKTGILRYWDDESCYFSEEKHLMHFTIKDTQNECDRRNIEKHGLDFYKQYLS
jgi:hypothetical protein